MRTFPISWMLAALFALTVGLLWGGAAWTYARDREQAITLAQTRLLGFARAFAEHALSSIQRVDGVLLTLRERWAEHPSTFAAEMHRQRKNLGDLTVLVGAVDAEGWVAFNSDNAKPVWSGDRHHYLAQARSAEDALVISPPTLGRISNRWFVQFSRKIHAEGPFTGLLFVAVDPRYYARFYESLGLGEGSAVAIVRDSGDFLARHPYSAEIMGVRISGTPYLEKDAPPRGNFVRTSQSDGVERLFAYHRLPEHGMTLTVAEPMQAILEPVRDRALRLAGSAVVMTLAIGLLFHQTLRSIARREKAERATLALNAELEQRVQDRTAQLEAVNRELQAFTYTVSHDLKAPLRGIDGYSHLLQVEYGDKLDEQGALYVRNLRRGTQQMSALISDLLAYSHLERIDLVTRPVELQRLVAGLLADRQHELDAAAIRVTNAVPPLTVNIDDRALTIALRNLIDNAIKFTRGRPQPAIEVGARADDSTIRIWVKDNGPGFDMAYKEKIFEMFQRLNRTEDYPGTGIGLALVRRAMERVGGTASAQSVPGEGATFHLEIQR